MANYGYIKLNINEKGELITEHLDKKRIIVLKNRNVVYIYRSDKLPNRNQRNFYIGMTTNFKQRHKQHFDGKEEKFNNSNFNEVVVFFSQQFDISAILDIEAQLITYFTSETEDRSKIDSDENKITNMTQGNVVNPYSNQEEISDIVYQIWSKVLYDELHWVDTPVLDKLRQKALFKYSPLKSLNSKQVNVIEKIINTPNKNFVIHGDAGTGKTVLLTHIVANLINRTDKKVAVVVQPNWKETARKIFKVYNFNSKNLLITTSTSLLNKFKNKDGIREEDKFDIVLIDESHKLSRYHGKQHASFREVYKGKIFNNYDNHLDCIRLVSKQVILMYDVYQAIRPANITRQYFEDVFKSDDFESEVLETQFRIDVSNDKQYTSSDYINGIKYLLYKDTGLLKNDESYNPNFNRKVFRDSSVNAYFGYFEKEPLHNLKSWKDEDENFYPQHINRILSGLVEEWKFEDGKNPDKYHFFEGDLELRWNSKQDDWINSKDKDAKDQIGSVFAVQGIDLNKVGVLIGNDLQIDSQGKLYGEKNNLKNQYSKYSKNEENEMTDFEFTLHVLNMYYVLLTRGIDGIRIGFWKNDDFKDYMKKTLDN
ncbi:DNA/RNA helicase domain-containing protein [Staphylococcus hominis]|uniref:DNA/RNA helicase domain-containing protein n=1 Tax=Staphylococcus hominis TaxID=1290 RepID=UPI002878F9CA|nr:DNA/RNA helicase domain-containing protein [Staphylococcus hominis]MDS3872196.1 DUF2075 domain-containing protein [Staphylococcus hominis]